MTRWSWSCAAVLTCVFLTSALTAAKQEAPQRLLIGGIFETGSGAQDAFNEAVRKAWRNVLRRLDGQAFEIDPNDVFAANTSVCTLLSSGALGIITDTSPQISQMVQRVASRAGIPHLTLEAWPGPVDTFSLRLRPSFAAILKIAFQAPPNPPGRDAAFITAGPTADAKRVVLRRLYPNVAFHLWRSGSAVALLNSLRVAGIRTFYLDLAPADVLRLLKTAYENRMDLPDYTFCIIATDFGAVRGDVAPLAEMAYEMRSTVLMKSLTTLNRPANEALIQDGVTLLATALDNLASAVRIVPRPVSCWSSSDSVPHGVTFFNYILMGVRRNTRTGPVEFDSNTRERSSFTFITQNVGKMAVRPTRMWIRPTRIPATRRPTTPSVSIRAAEVPGSITKRAAEVPGPITKRAAEVPGSITKRAAEIPGPIIKKAAPTVPLSKKPLRVVVVPIPPYINVGKEKETTVLTGHNIDLLMRLATDLEFNYTIYMPADGKFGAEKNGKWTGMIGELLAGNADLAVAPFTITYKRQQVVDFTFSYMTFGLKILTFRPTNSSLSPGTFLLPLTPTVWIVFLVAYIIVSLAIFLIAKLSPFEWHRSSHGSSVRINEFSLLNAFWFTIGGCLRQYPGLAPRSTSVRLLSGFWWLAVLLFLLCYVCNLFSIITTAAPFSPPFSSFNDLADQNTVKFGCLGGGSTEAFFKNSKIAAYRKIYQRMQETPGSFKDSYSLGIKAVLRQNGSYAFIGESTALKKLEKQDCRLRTLPGSINEQAYGFAFPKNSPFKEAFNIALLRLKERGYLEELQMIFFRENAAPCQKAVNPRAYSLSEVGFIFVLLILGLILACALGVLECICNRCCGVGRQPTETPLTDFRASLSATKREVS